MFDLTGKTALITGATGGIGIAIAKTMHAAGATVVLTGRNIDKLNSLKEELKTNIFTIQSDLSQPDSTKNLIAETLKINGKLDILVNNAGLTHDTLMMRMIGNVY